MAQGDCLMKLNGAGIIVECLKEMLSIPQQVEIVGLFTREADVLEESRN